MTVIFDFGSASRFPASCHGLHVGLQLTHVQPSYQQIKSSSSLPLSIPASVFTFRVHLRVPYEILMHICFHDLESFLSVWFSLNYKPISGTRKYSMTFSCLCLEGWAWSRSFIHACLHASVCPLPGEAQNIWKIRTILSEMTNLYIFYNTRHTRPFLPPTKKIEGFGSY